MRVKTGAPQRWGPGKKNWAHSLPEAVRVGPVCPTLRNELSQERTTSLNTLY